MPELPNLKASFVLTDGSNSASFLSRVFAVYRCAPSV